MKRIYKATWRTIKKLTSWALIFGITFAQFPFSSIMIAQAAEDLALNKPIVNQTGSIGSDNLPTKAIDGNDSTNWINNNTVPAYFTVDLGNGSDLRYNITSFDLYIPVVQYPVDFQIQGSNDAANYTTIYSKSSNTNQNIVGQGVSNSGYYRYIRLYVTRSSSSPNEYFYINSFRLYGTLGNKTNPGLSSLTPSTGSFSPAFSASTYNYTLTIPQASSSVNLTPLLAATAEGEYIKIKGNLVTNGQPYTISNLNYGLNPSFTVQTFSQDGSVVKTYTIAIQRGTDLALNKTIVNYTTPYGGTWVPSSAIDGDYTTPYVNNNSVPAYFTIDLGSGSDNRYNINAFNLYVPDNNGQYPVNFQLQGSNDLSTYTTIYSVTGNTAHNINSAITTTGYYRYLRIYVTKSSSSPNEYFYIYNFSVCGTLGVKTTPTLSSLTASVGSFSPAFSTSTYNYTLTIPKASTSVSITPTLADTSAGQYLTVNGSTVTNGQPYTVSNLNYGIYPTLLTVKACSQDGSLVYTYTIRVQRGEDLTYNKPIVNNTGYHSAPYVPSKAIDGDYSSCYINDATVPAYFTIDLGNGSDLRYNINAFNIYVPDSNSQYPVDYQIQGSNSSSSGFTTLYSKTGNTSHTINQSVSTTGYYRYIRVYVTKSSSSPNEYFYIYNFSVLGTLGVKTSTLSSLTSSVGSLSPAFASATTSYTVNVPQSTSSISLTPTLTDSNGSVKINGTAVTNGAASSVSLNYGLNIVTVASTSQDGSTTTTYTLKVYRGTDIVAGKTGTSSSNLGSSYPASNAVDDNLSTGWCCGDPSNPSFIQYDLGDRYNLTGYALVGGSGQYPMDYQIMVSNDNSNYTTVKSVTSNNIQNKSDAISMTGYYRYVRLYITKSSTYTNNYVWVQNFALMGNTGSKVSTLSNLATSAGSISPTFSSSTTTYTINVPYTTASVNLTPTLTDSTATVKVNGNAVTNGSAATISLGYGLNTIPVQVTSQDGSSVTTYYVKIYRGTDILVGKTATSTTTLGASYIAANVVDENLSTGWCNNNTQPSWILIDLGNIYNLKGYTMIGAAGQYPRNYLIQVSNDGSNFTTVKTVSGNTVYNITDSISMSGFYRYVRLYITQSSTTPNEYNWVYSFSVVGQGAYKVTYNGNNNTSGSVPTDSTQYTGQNATVLGNTGSLARTGYTYAGWNTLADGTGITYTASQSMAVSDDITLYSKWTPNTYDLTFNPQSGTVSPTSKTVTYDAAYGTVPTPTRTGYTFDGWFTETNGAGTEIKADTIVKITAATTIYAKWTINQYKVSFEGNGGSDVSDITQDYNTTIDTEPVTTKTGYTFGGWYTESSFANKVVFPYTIGASDTTFYAKWTIDQHKVSLVENGGDTVSDITQDYNTTIDSAPAITRNGFTFDGWFLDLGLTSAVTYPYTIGTSDVSFYAKWTRNQYIVKLEVSGGSTVEDIARDFNATIDTEPVSTKTGYTFAGWYTESGLTNKVTFPYTVADDVTLYAKWTVNQYKVSFVENGGSDVSDVTQDYNTTIDAEPVTAKTGYTFNGWYTEPEFSNKITFPYTIGATDVTLYAKFTINQYKVSFEENGGTAVGDITQNYGTTLSSAPAITKTGYTFSGWYSDLALTSPVVFPYTIGATDTIFYAKWTVNQYKVSFEANGGSAVSDVTQDYGTTINASPATTKTGYTFNGWYTDSTLLNEVTFPYTLGAEDTTLFAKWTIDQHKVSFEENGGSTASDITQDYNTKINTEPETTKTGYTFDGWYTEPEFSNKVVFPYTIGTSDVTFYANWTINQYKVRFEANLGTTVSDITQDYNTTIDTTPVTTKTGYTFDGWYTEPEFTNKVTFPYTIGASNVTMYAKWTINQYKVSYNTNNATSGTIPAAQASYDYGTTVTVAGNAGNLVKTGHTFMGWNTSADGSGTTYAENDTFALGAGDVTLYAKWNTNSYPVSYDGNGNTGGAAPLSSSYLYGYTVTVSGNTGSLAKTGYVFIGWNTKADGTGTDYAADATFTLEDKAVVLYAKWEIRGFVLTYDGNGSDGGTVATGGNYNYATNITVASAGTMTKTGHTFIDWNTKADGSGTTYFPNDVFELGAEDVTLYAEWDTNVYTVTYDGNGNTDGAVPACGEFEYGSIATASTKGALVKTGYTFAGWNTKADGLGTPYAENATFTLGDIDVTLYAQWTCNKYDVAYNGNESTGGTAPTGGNYDYGTSITVSGNTGTLVKTGYTFAGWNTKADGTGTSYNASDVFSLGASNVTLYAKWDINTYTVSYDANGATEGTTPSSSENVYNTLITVTGNTGTLEKTGYTFSGWNTKADGSGTSYVANNTFSLGAGNVVLYAKWTANKYTVTFDSKEGSAVTAIDVDYNTLVTAPTPAPTKTGYDFAGWYRDSDCTFAWNFASDKIGASEMTLYAKWTPKQYKINFNENGGAEIADKTLDYKASVNSTPETTKTGYTFEGWYSEAELTNKVVFPYTVGLSDVTFYAKWTINQYKVSFSENGGSDVADITQNYNTTINVAPETTKAGYTLDGWYSESTFVNKVAFPYTIGAEDVTLYAKWTINQYKISFSENGGSDVTDVTQDYNTTISAPPNTTKTGYTFAGWYTEATLENKVTFPYMITNDATLYAKWTINQYKVSFEENGGSALSDIIQDYNSTITAPEITKSGYTLDGFYSEPTFVNKVTFPYTLGSEDVTLYAKWTINQYKVSFDEDGGSAVSDITQDYDTSITTSPVTAKTGYTLDGWYSESTFENKVTFPYTIGAEDVTLYAKWTINQYKVSFDEDGGSTVVDITQDYNTTIDTPNITKTGYTLDGWYSESTFENKVTFPYTIGAEDVTLYAKWTINQYKVSFEENGGSTVADITQDYNTTVATPGITKTGYTLEGWYSEATFENKVAFPYAIGAEDITLHAKWTINQYKVSFDEDGGSTVADITQDYNTEIAEPEITKTGYTFNGWYSEATFENEVTFPYTIGASDATLYAKWTINQYKVSFEENGGSDVADVTQDYNTTVATPAITKTGYTLEGWYSEATFENKITFPYTMGASDVTVHAKWTINQYKVTYDEKGGSEVADVNQDYKTQIDTEPTTDKEGYAFLGWYTDEEYTTEVAFPYTIEDSNVTFYAKWYGNKYTVSFEENGGSAVDDVTDEFNAVIISRPEPAKTGYTFDGWYKNESLTTKAYFPYIIGSSDVTLYAKWNINQYKVSFEEDGGSVVADITQDYNTTITTQDITKTGYTLEGWYTEPELVNRVSFPYSIGAADATLYAKWTTNQYKISFEENGGISIDDLIENYNTTIDTAPVVTKAGYTFEGWYKDSALTDKITFPYTVGASDVTFYAKWIINQYTVTFNENDGSAVSDVTQNFNTSINTSPVTTKTGYTFDGWYSELSLTNKVEFPYTIGASNITLFAKWNINSYKVKYDANGATGGAVPVAESTHEFGSNITVSDNTGSLVKTGYTFKGWNTKADGTGTSYAANSVFVLGAGDVTLYAMWQINSYKVSYDENGYTEGNAPASNDHNFASTITVSGNTGSLAKTGYTFAGWNTKADGTGTSYTSGNTFTLGASNITLYARWTINSYDVTYDGNGSDSGSVPTSGTHNYGTNITVSGAGTLSSAGHTFIDWNTKADGSGTTYYPGDVFVLGAGNTTLYAEWEINSYTVTYDGNGKTGGSVPVSGEFEYNSTATAATKGTLVRTGYTFTGWNTKADGSGTTYSENQTFLLGTKDVTLYAQWTINSYAVSYNGNSNTGGTAPTGGSYNYASNITVSGNTGALLKTGYTFAGWNTKADGSGTAYAANEIFSLGAGDVTLYALWQINSYTVSYDGNGASGGSVPTGTNYQYNSDVTVSSNTGSLLKTGYTFAGWNTKADGSGSAYATNATFKMGDGLVTLYAQWTRNTYKVTFDSQGGLAVDPINSASYDSLITKPTDPTKTGYPFGGWYLEEECINAWDFDSSKVGSADFTLYAKWIVIKYTISFEENGGSSATDVTQDYSTYINISPTPLKAGYKFEGWYSDSDLNNAIAFPYQITNDATLYAKWTINKYTVSFEENGGTTVADINQNYDTTIAKPTDPTRSNYVFVSWYKESTFETLWNFDTDKIGASNTILYAKWIKKGDVNMDGVVDTLDARMVLRSRVGYETLSDLQIKVADMNNDNCVDSLDARMILILISSPK